MNKLDEDFLKRKYGEAKILVINNSKLFGILNKANFNDCFYPSNDTEALDKVVKNGQYMLRYKAENDNNFKQPIPYVIFRKKESGMLFCMERISGDSRLIGKKSLGVGGHVDNDEGIKSGLYREIYEEVGLEKKEINSLKFLGFILDESNDVGSVHLGLLFVAEIDENMDLQCREKDTLRGFFASRQDLANYSVNNQLETWSVIALNYIKGE